MTALVTGAAGFIGSHLVDRLLDLGETVIGVDCLTDYYAPADKLAHIEGALTNPKFQFHTLDLATESVEPLLGSASTVYHLAGQPGVRGSWGGGFETYVRNNIDATQRLLEVLRNSRARLVYASSSSVYGDADLYPTAESVLPSPISPYGVSKLCGEQLVMAYHRSFGVDSRSVRYFTVYGPRQRPDMAFSRFISAILDGRPIDVFGDGNQTRDFTFVSDAVEATIRTGELADPPERVFNVGGGSRITVNDLLELLGRVSGRNVLSNAAPEQPGDVRDTGADLTRSNTVLGWRPVVSIESGLKAQFEAAVALRGS